MSERQIYSPNNDHPKSYKKRIVGSVAITLLSAGAAVGVGHHELTQGKPNGAIVVNIKDTPPAPITPEEINVSTGLSMQEYAQEIIELSQAESPSDIVGGLMQKKESSGDIKLSYIVSSADGKGDYAFQVVTAPAADGVSLDPGAVHAVRMSAASDIDTGGRLVRYGFESQLNTDGDWDMSLTHSGNGFGSVQERYTTNPTLTPGVKPITPAIFSREIQAITTETFSRARAAQPVESVALPDVNYTVPPAA